MTSTTSRACCRLALDPEWRRSRGEIGARRMREHFSWSDLARRRLQDYERARTRARGVDVDANPVRDSAGG